MSSCTAKKTKSLLWSSVSDIAATACHAGEQSADDDNHALATRFHKPQSHVHDFVTLLHG